MIVSPSLGQPITAAAAILRTRNSPQGEFPLSPEEAEQLERKLRHVIESSMRRELNTA